MRPISVTVSSQTTSDTIPVDWRENDFKATLTTVVTGTLTYSVQFTVDDVQDSSVTPTWIDADTLTSLTATSSGSLVSPVTAVRLNVTTFSSGNATLTVLQSGGR